MQRVRNGLLLAWLNQTTFWFQRGADSHAALPPPIRAARCPRASTACQRAIYLAAQVRSERGRRLATYANGSAPPPSTSSSASRRDPKAQRAYRSRLRTSARGVCHRSARRGHRDPRSASIRVPPVCHFVVLHRVSWRFLALTAPVRETAGCPLITTFGAGNEADAGTRTPDPIITSDVLYQLSYVGVSRPRIAVDLGDRDVAPGPARG